MRRPQLFERWELIGVPGLPFEAESARPVGQPEARSSILGQPEKPIFTKQVFCPPGACPVRFMSGWTEWPCPLSGTGCESNECRTH